MLPESAHGSIRYMRRWPAMAQIQLSLEMWKRFEQQVARMGARGSRFAINEFLNMLAFGARRYYPVHLAKSMDIRKKGFVASSFGVKRSRPRDLVAYTYSKRRDRFSGWTEQQRGVGKLREKVGFVRARTRKTEGGQIVRGFRMNKRGKFAHINDMPGGSPKQRFARLLRTVREEGAGGPRKLFIAGGNVTGKGGELPWGLWRMSGKSRLYPDRPHYQGIAMLQKFDPPAPTGKDEWAGEGAMAYLAQEDVRGKWMTAYARSWRHAKKG